MVSSALVKRGCLVEMVADLSAGVPRLEGLPDRATQIEIYAQAVGRPVAGWHVRILSPDDALLGQVRVLDDIKSDEHPVGRILVEELERRVKAMGA